jgi:hypothetical protein
MSKEPLALRQADALEDFPSIVDLMNAASTLRHLHEVNTELLEALRAASEALRGWAGPDETSNAKNQALAAIAKATGETQ